MRTDFANLSLKSILGLIGVLSGTNSNKLAYCRRRFEENAMGFEETIYFLSILNLVNYDEENIERTRKFKSLIDRTIEDKSLIIQYIIELMLDSNNSLSKTLNEYLSKFSQWGDALAYKPSAKVRRLESGIRNLLIEFGIIEYSESEKSYYISDEYMPLFVGKSLNIYQTPKELEFLLAKQKEIGNAAEMEILKYENKRLENYPNLLTEVQLISQKDVNAGYDIRSIEIGRSNGSPEYRYIEVKAISLTDYRFFWSRNEIDTAKSMGRRYYLYLLPVIAYGEFDLSKLKIISNAYKNVFLSNSNWTRIEELYSFSCVAKAR